MVRSFTDRVFGGVCGGLASALHIGAWWIRALFIALTVASLGAFIVVYVLLWWIIPQHSFTERRRGIPTLIVLVLILALSAAWIALTFGALELPVTLSAGVNPFWLGAIILLSAVFFVRQLRG